MTKTIKEIKAAIKLAKQALKNYRENYDAGQMNESEWIKTRESFAGKINGLYQALEIAEESAAIAQIRRKEQAAKPQAPSRLNLDEPTAENWKTIHDLRYKIAEWLILEAFDINDTEEIFSLPDSNGA